MRAAWLALLLLAVCPVPAFAQVSAAVSVESDYRLRGYSVSGERPVGVVRVGYDDASGAYADGSVAVVASRFDGLRVLGYEADAGFATQLGSLWTIDLGVAREDLDPAYPGSLSYRHTEAYVGARRGPFSAYVFASPSYGRSGSPSLYGQLDATVSPFAKWRLTAHAGLLKLLDTPPRYATHYDWRLGVAREIGDFDLHVAVSGGGPPRRAYPAAAETKLTAGLTFGF